MLTSPGYSHKLWRFTATIAQNCHMQDEKHCFRTSESTIAIYQACLYWSTGNKMTPAISPWSFFTLQVKGRTQSYFILKSLTSCCNSKHSVTVHLHSRNQVQTHWEISTVLYSESQVNTKTQKYSRRRWLHEFLTILKIIFRIIIYAAWKFGNKDTASCLFNQKKHMIFSNKKRIFSN